MPGLLPFLNTKHLNALFLIGLSILIIGLPYSPVLMSIGTIWLCSVYILEGNFKEKWSLLKKNRIVLSILALVLWHIIGLLWSDNPNNGVKYLVKILPLFVLPIVFSGINVISNKQKRYILWLFILVLLSAIMCYLFRAFFILEEPIRDTRNLVIFTSHIRLSLFICFGLAFVFFQEVKVVWKMLIALPLLLFVVYIQSFTAAFLIVVLLIVYLFEGFSENGKTSTWIKLGFSLALVCTISFMAYTYADYYSTSLEQGTPELTSRGNAYNPELENGFIENGSYLWSYVSYIELEQGWKKRTGQSIWDKGVDGFPHYSVLIRYLNNLGLKKDLDGVNALNDQDVQSILNANPYPNQIKFKGFSKRLRGLLFHYEKSNFSKDFVGNSLAEKVVFQNIGIQAYLEKPILGVGTGGLKDALRSIYENEYPDLNHKHHRMPHNQYVSILGRVGVLGLIFLLIVFYALWNKPGGKLTSIQKVFVILMMSSFFTEDTLDTQAGVTFFSCFIGILFLLRNREV